MFFFLSFRIQIVTYRTVPCRDRLHYRWLTTLISSCFESANEPTVEQRFSLVIYALNLVSFYFALVLSTFWIWPILACLRNLSNSRCRVCDHTGLVSWYLFVAFKSVMLCLFWKLLSIKPCNKINVTKETICHVSVVEDKAIIASSWWTLLRHDNFVCILEVLNDRTKHVEFTNCTIHMCVQCFSNEGETAKMRRR